MKAMLSEKPFTQKGLIRKTAGFWVLLITLSLLQMPPLYAEGVQKPLTLDQVLQKGVDGNEALRNASDKLISKRLESQSLKEKQIKALLEYPIEKLLQAKLSEDPNALGLLERQATIQNLDLEIIQLEKDIDKTLGDLCKNLRQTYYDILIQSENLSYENQQIALFEPRLAKAVQKYQLGLVGKTSVSPLQENLLNAQEGAFKASTLLELYSADMAKKLGIEDLSGYKLVIPKPVPQGDETWFKAIREKLPTDNIDLQRSELEAKLAVRDFEALMLMTKNSYGSQVAELEKMAKAPKADYKAFFSSYEKLLSTQRLIPEDYYPLSLGAYAYMVPITQLKTPLKPIEYLQKERYPLQYALNNRDIKQESYQSLLKQTQSLFEQVQNTLMSSDKLSKDNAMKLKDLTQQMALKQKLSLLGEADYNQVILLEDQIRDLSHSQIVGSFEVQKSLADLEQLVPKTIFKQLDSELAQKIKRVPPAKGQWAFNMGLGHFTWEFSLSLPQGSPVVYYELWQGENRLAEKLPVSQTLTIKPETPILKLPEDTSKPLVYMLKLIGKMGIIKEIPFRPESAYGQFEVK